MKNTWKERMRSRGELRRRPYGDTLERTFKIQMTLSVLAIIACIVALFSTTFAYYYKELDSQNNNISSASWSLHVEYANESKVINGEYTLKLSKHEEHNFNIIPIGKASEGYCVIKIEDEDGIKKYTTYVFDSSNEGIKVKITAKEGSVVSFKAYWGSPTSPLADPGDRTLTITHSYNFPYDYVVKEGDTLIGIAKYYGVDAEDILAYNGISDITVGEEIGIIDTDIRTEYYNRSVDREYIIQDGDTLSSIALRFDVPINDLMIYNNISNADEIKSGDKLIIPALTAVIKKSEQATV